MKKASVITFVLMIVLSFVISACGESSDSENDGDIDVQESADDSEDSEDGDIDSEQEDTGEVENTEDEQEFAEKEAEVEEEYIACDNPDGCFEIPFAINRTRGSQGRESNNVLPFPYNYFSLADASTPTGIKLSLAPALGERKFEFNTRLIDTGLTVMDHARYVRAMNTKDGFSVSGHLMIESGEQIDQSLFAAVKGPDNNDNKALYLVNISESSDNFGQRIAYRAEVKEAVDGTDEQAPHLFWYLLVQPEMPLEPKTRYAVVLTKDLRSIDQRPPQMSAHFQQVWGVAALDEKAKAAAEISAERQRMAEVKEILSGSGFEFIDMNKVVLAYDFTTQSVNDDILYIVDQYNNLTPSAPDLDYDEDGTPNYYHPEEWPGELESTHPSWDENIDYVALGTMEMPEWRHCTNKDDMDACYYEFVNDADYHPIQNGSNKLRFWVFFPKNAVQPMPLVIGQHGIWSKKEDVGKIGRYAAQTGAATILIDLPFHGDRAVGFPPTEFIDTSYPLKAASNFKQAFTEHNWIFRAAEAGVFDIYPNGTGDGIPDFDADRLGYFGHSLGAIIGETSVTVSPQADMAILCVGGTKLFDYIKGAMGELLFSVFSEYEVNAFGLVAQTILDSGDFVSYSHLLREKHSAGNIQYLFQMSMEDETIPANFSTNFAVFAGVDQVEPVAEHFEGLQSFPAPYTGGKGHFQFPGANHNYVFQSEEAANQTIEFMRSFFSTGTGTVANTLGTEVPDGEKTTE